MGRPVNHRQRAPVRRRGPLRSPIALLVALAVAGAVDACIDLTPASERGRVTVLAPHLLRPGLQAALDNFSDMEAAQAEAPRFGNCAEVARAAAAGDAPLVLTAHPAWASYIAQRVTVLDRAVLGSDTLVLVGHGRRPSQAPLVDPAALLDGPEIVGLPSTESAAVGMYAREALLRYGIWSRMERRLRSFGGIGDALAALDEGEIDAAIVPRSTATREGREILLSVDPAFHQPIVYEVLLLDDARPEARALFDYLAGPAGRSAFQQAGFAPPA